MCRNALVSGVLFLGLILGLTGCKKNGDGPPRPNLEGRNLKVLATTSMIADAVKAIGQEHVDVDCLMPPPTDPHKYTAGAPDLERIRKADLVLYNGLHLEGKITDVLESRAKSAWTVAVTDGLCDLRPAEEGFEGSHDPHVWFDVRMWMKVVEKIRDTLADIDPRNRDQYRENAAKYLQQLEALDSEVREKLARVPSYSRVLITAHDAFGYFGRAYGFEVKGLQGVSTATDTSTRDVQDLADLIGTRRIKAIFAESSVPDAGVLAVQQAVRSKYKGFEVRLAEDLLYSDALGSPGTSADTYIGMVRHNVDAIVKALGE
jgi:manganese/zinc/iron transport system substrate-binding protein